MTRISVCCLTFNSEQSIRKTLDSIKNIADEIVIIDSYSTDRTLEIVREYTDKVFFRTYTFHGLQMNYGLDQCTHDWVFCIDSDEIMDQDMARHILALKESGLEGKEAFRIHRQWFFLGKPVHAFYPVVSPDRIIRFFDRTIVHFNDKPVHDQPVGQKGCSWLKGYLLHYSTGSLDELYDKLNKYTTRIAQGSAASAPRVSLAQILFNPAGAFIKWYFLKKNFLDGFRGFVLGVYAAMYTFLKYVKLYHLRINKKTHSV